MSRSSVYETIQEEASVLSSSPSPKHPTPQSVAKQAASPLLNNSVYVVDGDSESIYTRPLQRAGVSGLTPPSPFGQCSVSTLRFGSGMHYSLFVIAFQPPKVPAVMQAMLEHSQKNYGPLPSELRPHRVRSRTSSRASPYPLRNQRSAFSPEKPRSSPIQVFTDGPNKAFAAPAPEQPVLREVQHDANVYQSSPAPALDEIKPFSPFHIQLDTSKQGKGAFGPPSRPRVTSSTRHAALGWSKRSTGKSTQDCKENLSASSIIPTRVRTEYRVLYGS